MHARGYTPNEQAIFALKASSMPATGSEPVAFSTLALKEEVECISKGWSNSIGLLDEIERVDKRFRGWSGLGEMSVTGESLLFEVSTGTDATSSFFSSASFCPLVDRSGFVAGGDFVFTIAAASALSITAAPTETMPPGVFFALLLLSEALNGLLRSPSVLPSLLYVLLCSATLSLPLSLPPLPPAVRLRGVPLDLRRAPEGLLPSTSSPLKAGPDHDARRLGWLDFSLPRDEREEVE